MSLDPSEPDSLDWCGPTFKDDAFAFKDEWSKRQKQMRA